MASSEETGKSRRSDLSFLLTKGGLAFLLRGLTMAGQYLLIFTLARMYGPATMGNFTLALIVLQLFAILAQAGLDNRLTRVVAASGNPISLNRIRTAYSQSLLLTFLISTLVAVMLYLLSGWIATTWFHKPQLEQSLQYIAIALVPFVLIGINGAAFRGLKNMTGFLLFRGLIPFLTVIPLYIAGTNGTITPVAAYSFATLLLCGASFVTWYRYSGIQTANYQEPEPVKFILSDALPMMLTGSVFFLLNWTDNLLLGIFRSETEVGLYDTAFKIASASAIVLMGLNAIQGPVFAELYQKKDIAALNKQVKQSTKISFFITLPFTVIVCVLNAEILQLFGTEFMLAGTALVLLAIGNFISSISGSVGILLQMTGHQKAYNKIITSTAIGSILLNIILIPRFGITGAAIASGSAKIIQNIASVIYTYRTTGLFTLYLPGIDKLFPFKQSSQG
jgi:O-antigen/teichoic acid export membrane protein